MTFMIICCCGLTLSFIARRDLPLLVVAQGADDEHEDEVGKAVDEARP